MDIRELDENPLNITEYTVNELKLKRIKKW